MVKPGSIIGGFIVAISIALQVVTLLEVAQFYWLLFIWGAGVIAGGFYIAGGLAFGDSEKMEHYTISGIGLGAIIALTVYFSIFQFENIDDTLQLTSEYWVYGAVLFSTLSAFLVMIAPLFMVTGAGKQLKGVKPGAILGGILISISLALQIIVVIHLRKTYWLIVFWFIGLIGAIALSIGARARGYNSTEAFVIAGVFIGVLLFMVIYFSVSPRMIEVIETASDNQAVAPSHEDLLPTWASVVLSFAAAIVAFMGVMFSSASMRKRAY